MQYSYESWANQGPNAYSPENLPEVTDSSFPFSQDLKELEDSLAMDFTEGMSAWAEIVQKRPNPAPDVLAQTHWDELVGTLSAELTRMMAKQVQTSLQTVHQPQLEQMQRMAESYYQDNKDLSAQIHHLVGEREKMLAAIASYEMELARYRHLMGNLYLKF